MRKLTITMPNSKWISVFWHWWLEGKGNDEFLREVKEMGLPVPDDLRCFEFTSTTTLAYRRGKKE